MRVLIADDTKLMRSMLSEWVTSLGFEVLLASDGDQAIRAAQQNDFDIAIIDWEMPKLTGMEVVKRFRAWPRTAYVHIILITACENDDRLIQALEGGADDYISKPIAQASLMAHLRAGARIVEMRKEILKLAGTDMLTGTVNRRAFMERSSQQLAGARRTASPVSVLVADLDFFKRINDTYGHAGGDVALKTFASTCADMLRPLDMLGRIGGEEFAILLPGTQLPEAVAVGERLRAAVERKAIPFGDVKIRLTVSIGAAKAETEAETIEPALAAADAALYRAKENGRNRVIAEVGEGCGRQRLGRVM